LKECWHVFPLESFRNSLTKIVRILQQHGIAFHLTGGVTSISYGEPRLTQDIDMVVDNSAAVNGIEGLIESLKNSDFLFDETTLRNGVKNKRMFQLLDTKECLKLDIYPRELIAGELTRSESREIFTGVHLPVASLPDATVSKLIWISKGSHKNRRDVRQIISRATATELQTINELVVDLELQDLLAEVLSESDEIE
jgi:hypothetical protein